METKFRQPQIDYWSNAKILVLAMLMASVLNGCSDPDALDFERLLCVRSKIEGKQLGVVEICRVGSDSVSSIDLRWCHETFGIPRYWPSSSAIQEGSIKALSLNTRPKGEMTWDQFIRQGHDWVEVPYYYCRTDSSGNLRSFTVQFSRGLQDSEEFLISWDGNVQLVKSQSVPEEVLVYHSDLEVDSVLVRRNGAIVERLDIVRNSGWRRN